VNYLIRNGFATLLFAVLFRSGYATTTNRNDWYWDSLVNLHIDNHSRLVGKGKTADEIAALLKPLPVDIIQVSAYGSDGAMTTYPSSASPATISMAGTRLPFGKKPFRRLGSGFMCTSTRADYR